MFVCCVHPVAVHHAAFSLLMLVDDARGILQSWSHNCLVGIHECSFCLPHPRTVSVYMICRGSCAYTEMLWMGVLYVSFESKVRPRTYGRIAIRSNLLCIFRSRLLVYYAGSGVNRVQVVLFCPGKNCM